MAFDTGNKDEGEATLLDIRRGGAGNYVVAASTCPLEVALKAAAFND